MQSTRAFFGPLTRANAIGLALALGVAAAGSFYLFQSSLNVLWRRWMDYPEHSFGVFIPFITAYLLYQRRQAIAAAGVANAWPGVAVIVLGLGLLTLGNASVSLLISNVGFVVVILGLAWATLGTAAMKVALAPLCFLFLMIPAPDAVVLGLSQKLQLVSSWLGVALIRACGVSVYLEGNVIDLGQMKLQVAEACSGLRYLLSLLVLGIVAAYFFKAPRWQRAMLVASTIPITIGLNSFRIALVGLTVDIWGRSAAEGVLHDFEGLVVFGGAMLVLIGEMWLLARLSGRSIEFVTVYAGQSAGMATTSANHRKRWGHPSLGAAVLLMAAASVTAMALPERTMTTPPRASLESFPEQFAAWTGKRGTLEPEHLQQLKLDDYLLADYSNERGNLVNLHIQYYNEQKGDRGTHSPRKCIPAGGWEISSFEARTLDGAAPGTTPLRFNRAVVERGDAKLLVYYWFQQRGRNTTSEIETKLAIVWDAATKGRSDGAMVRLVTPLRSGETPEQVDRRLSEFAAHVTAVLPRFVPD